jgi:AcrR family transcriptional regulator
MIRRFVPRPAVPRACRAARREAIVEAAHAVLARDGPASFSLSATAKNAGFGVLTVFLHFPGKRAVLRELWRRDHDWRVGRLGATIEALSLGVEPKKVFADHAVAEIGYRRRYPGYAVLRRLAKTMPSLRSVESAEIRAAIPALADTMRRLFPQFPAPRATAIAGILIGSQGQFMDVTIQYPELASKLLHEWTTLWLGYFDYLRNAPLATAAEPAFETPTPRRASSPAARPSISPRRLVMSLGAAFRRIPATPGPAREDDILDAGDAVLAARGIKGFTVRAVARQAGVTTAAVRSLFSDETDLLRAIVARDVRNRARLALPLIEGVATAPNLERQIHALMARIRETRPTGSWAAVRLAVLSRRDLASADDDWHDAWMVPLATALGRRYRNLSSARAAVAARFLIITHLIVTHLLLSDFVASQPGSEEALHAEWEKVLTGYVTRLGRSEPEFEASA